MSTIEMIWTSDIYIFPNTLEKLEKLEKFARGKAFFRLFVDLDSGILIEVPDLERNFSNFSRIYISAGRSTYT